MSEIDSRLVAGDRANESPLGKGVGHGDITTFGSGGTSESFSHLQWPVEFRRAEPLVSDATQAAA